MSDDPDAVAHFGEDGDTSQSEDAGVISDRLSSMNLKEKVKRSKKDKSKPKRRGRPPKNPEPEPEPEQEVAPIQDSPQTASIFSSLLGLGGGPEQPPTQEEINAKHAKLVRVAQGLKGKLGAIGSGMTEEDMAAATTTDAQLEAEIALLNSDLNSKRADKGIQGIFLFAADLIEGFSSRFVPNERMDLSTHFHLSAEVKNNWDDMFKETATHLAILHGDWFAVNPYLSGAQAMAACMASCNEKNKAFKYGAFAMRARGMQPTAEQSLAQSAEAPAQQPPAQSGQQAQSVQD